MILWHKNYVTPEENLAASEWWKDSKREQLKQLITAPQAIQVVS